LGPNAAISRLLLGAQNVPDACLPTILLLKARQELVGTNKSKKVSMDACHKIASFIKDSAITPEVVFAYMEKQRAIHLRRVAGASRGTQTRQRNALIRAAGVVVDGQVEYQVEKIIKKRWNDEESRHEYFVKWKGHGHDENTW
jgi:hypothetical protein